MEVESILVLFLSLGHLTQAAVSLLLAGLLVLVAKVYRRRFLTDWSLSWAALALFYGAAAFVCEPAPADGEIDVVRLVVASVSLLGGYLHLVWLIWGVLGLQPGEPSRRSLYVPSLLVGGFAGVGAAVLSLDAEPALRAFVRGGLHSLAIVCAYCWLAWALRRRSPTRPALGAGFLACAAVVFAANHLFDFAARLVVWLDPGRMVVLAGDSGVGGSGVGGRALGEWVLDAPPAVLFGTLFVELIVLTAIALSTAVWLLEEERARLKESSDTLRRSQARLRKAHRLEAIGRLAGGLANDFNNLLTTVLGYSQLLLTRFGPDDPLRKDVLAIQGAGERAAGMTRQLLAFSRRQVLHPQLIELDSVLESLRTLVIQDIGDRYRITVESRSDLSEVMADEAQLRQVLRNLISNAFDAMPAGGTVQLTSENVELSEHDVASWRPMPAGSWVMLSVHDEGVGMDRSTLDQLFEPFFSTKERGKASGLGLATAYGIIKQSGGYIFAESEVDRGSTLRIFLPPASKEEAQRLTVEQWDVHRNVAGLETVLVVEDDAAVRGLVQVLLESQGYDVLLAADGREALEKASRPNVRPRLVLTALVMPDLSGPEVVDGLVQLVPDIEVLYVSGHSDDHLLLQAGPPVRYKLLEKPFTPERLLSAVRRALDRPPD